MKNSNKNSTFVLWLTGLSGSGKTTIAQNLKNKLEQEIKNIHHLDGDEVRAKAKIPLGFTAADRDKNIKLAIDLAKEYQQNNINIIASFISPYTHHRNWGRKSLDNYMEIFIDSPLEICQQRDPKGLYQKALKDEIKNFTGISDPYEKPLNPELHIQTHIASIEKCVDQIYKHLKNNSWI